MPLLPLRPAFCPLIVGIFLSAKRTAGFAAAAAGAAAAAAGAIGADVFTPLPVPTFLSVFTDIALSFKHVLRKIVTFFCYEYGINITVK
jgi:hypothetical protein